MMTRPKSIDARPPKLAYPIGFSIHDQTGSASVIQADMEIVVADIALGLAILICDALNEKHQRGLDD